MRTAATVDPALERVRAAVQQLFLAVGVVVALAAVIGLPEARESVLFGVGCLVVVGRVRA